MKTIEVDIRFTVGDKDYYRIVRTNSKKTLVYKNWIKYTPKKEL